jgi:hypothetical protein
MTVMDKATGRPVSPGATIHDFRREGWELVGPTDVSTQGRAGKVHVQRTVCHDGEMGVVERWLYASVFGLYVTGIMSCGCPVGPDNPGHLDTCNEI